MNSLNKVISFIDNRIRTARIFSLIQWVNDILKAKTKISPHLDQIINCCTTLNICCPGHENSTSKETRKNFHNQSHKHAIKFFNSLRKNLIQVNGLGVYKHKNLCRKQANAYGTLLIKKPISNRFGNCSSRIL